MIGAGKRAGSGTRRKAKDRDDWRCQRCGRVGGSVGGRLEVHHLRPVKDGGGDELSNLTVLCRSCHIDGHRSEPKGKAEWRRWLRAC